MEFDGRALARLRAMKALTLAELEERAGLGAGVAWKLESGFTKRPHAKTIRKVAETLGVEPAALLRERSPAETEKATPE